MATIKISELRSTSPVSIDCEEEFIGAVENAVIRAVEARQLQELRGGKLSNIGVMPIKKPILMGLPILTEMIMS